MTAVETTEKAKLCNSTTVKPGDKWSRLSYGKVLEKERDGKGGWAVVLENDDGLQWRITSDIFESEFRIHDQHTATEEVTVTEMAEKFIASPRMIMTVCFNKQVEPNELADTLLATISEAVSKPGAMDAKGPLTQRNWRKTVRNAFDDNERVMVGRHTGERDTGGRIFFTDMEAPKNSNVRRVDPRTLRWMIVDNVKYVTK